MTLALVDDHSLVDAPPLELVFTVDEERGLRGAKQISPQLLTASRLLNLDTETEGEIYISCAGSMDVAATIPAPREPAPANSAWVRLEIGELPGGHSGIDIHNDRVNPLTVFPHFVQRFIDSGMELRIASIAGGDKRNAIPKRLEVLLVIPAAEESTLLERVDEVWKECARSVFPGAANPGRVSVASRLGDEVIAPMTKDTEGNILAALSALPHGVIAWSQAVAGLVETSNNVARITTNGNVVGIECMARSSAPAALQGVVLQLDAIFRAHGFKVETANESPGWEAESESELLARTSAAYRDTLGITPEIRAVHAGLECGAFKRVNPALQMVSFGPDIGGAHTPEEYVSIPSVSNIYRVLQEVVRRHASLNA
jgi:dipeptidase D